MSSHQSCNCSSRTWLLIGLVLTLVLGGLITGRLLKKHQGKGPRTARAEERDKNMAEYQSALAKETSGYGVVNKDAGIYRIPMERAMEIAAREWKNPEQARALLTNRVLKAVPPPPPAAPAPKSQFE